MKIRRAAPFAAALLAGGLLAQQEKTPVPQSGVVIETETRLVLVDTVVTDKKGNYIRDLAQKDFRVWEDNKEQTIKNFSFEADASSPNNGQKRYLVLFFDNSTMDAGDQARARAAAARFIETNTGPNRMIALVNFGGTLQIAQNFTDDVDRLKRAVAQVKISSTGDLLNSSVSNPAGGPRNGPDLNAAANDFAVRDMILSLRSLARNLGTVPGRKILVLLTGGTPLNPDQMGEVTATLDACNRANVAIYPIDVRGLAALAPLASLPPARFAPWRSLAGAHSLFQLGSYSPVSSFVPQRGGGGGGISGGVGGGGGGGGAPAGGGGGGGRGGGGGAVGAPGGGFGSPGGGRGGPAGAPGGFGGQQGGAPPGAGQGRGGAMGAPPPPPPGMPGPYNQSRDIIPKFPESTTTNQQIMYMLANGTGGFVIHDTNDLLAGLQKIGREQNEYYILGYTPPPADEGSCHVLRVKVNRGGTEVRSRTGYCNAKPHDVLKGNPIEKTLESRAAGTKAGDVTASMTLPYFYTSANVARVNIAMEINTNSLNFEKEKGKMHAAVNVLGMAYLPDGGVAARFSDIVKFEFPGKHEVEEFKKKPYHYENQFEVAAGKYNLKVVFNSGNESFGKLEMPLSVDPFDPDKFALSGLALSKEFHASSAAGLGLDASLLEDKTPLITNGVLIVPSGSNLFRKADQRAFYFEVYEPLLRVTPPRNDVVVAIQMRILDRKTGAEKDVTPIWKLDLPKPGESPVIRVAERLLTDKLVAGAYTLELTAIDSVGNQAKRVADFETE